MGWRKEGLFLGIGKMLAIKRNIHHRVWIMPYRGAKGITYKVCFSEQRKRRTARSFHDKATATKYRRDFERFLNGKGPHPDETERYDPLTHTSWDSAVEEYVGQGDRKPSSTRNIRLRLGLFRRDMGIISVEQVTEDMIERWLKSCRTKKRKDQKKTNTKATVSTHLSTLAAFFRWARPQDCPITAELIKRWKPYKIIKRSRPHIYTEQEFDDLNAAAEQIDSTRSKRDALWWKAFLHVAYYSGFRLDEISHLIWADVDWQENNLKVQPHHRLKGVIDWTPKGKAHRTVPVPAETMRLLHELLERQTEGIPYVFLEMDRYAQVIAMNEPPRSLLNMVLAQYKVKVRNRAKILEGTIHDFRRTFATRLLRQDVPVHHVQALCGHQQLTTTLDIYNEVREEDAVEAARNVLNNGTRVLTKSRS